MSIRKIAVLLLACVMALTACGAYAELTPGTYEGTAQGFGGTVTVKVTVDASAITAAEITGAGETPALGGAAIGGDFAYGGYASAKIAVGDACSGAHPFPLDLKGLEWSPSDVLALADAAQLPVPRWLLRLLLGA